MKKMSMIRGRRRMIAALVATAACLAPGLAACSGGNATGASSDGPSGTIKFLGHTGIQASMDPVIKSFEAAYPNIHVQTQYAPSGPTYTQTVVTQIQGGNAPDVFYSNGGTGSSFSISPLAKSGKILDLSDQSWASTIPSDATDMYKIDGKTYGLNLDESPSGILYNVGTFSKMGLRAPKTFSDVLQVCSTARSQGRYGIALPGQNAGFAAEIVAGSIVYSSTPDWDAQRNAGKTTFAGTAGWQQTLSRFQQMQNAECFQPGAASASSPQAIQAMTTGQALMTIVPSGTIGSVANGKPNDWAMAPFPGDSESQTRATIGYQDALAVSSTTKNKAAALAFLNYLAGPAASTYANASGTVSLADAKSGTLSQPLQGVKPYFDNKTTISRPADRWPGGGALNTLSTAVVSSMTGQSSIDDALKSVDQAWGK
ncbi:extracellular solute-binding protein [Sinomonas sp. ASV486]|uniref:ABC transporter substrate-binding protein n=1 Tax=Sinomonas sp. ASV486 TaxID=3051170 RepID=UPI0027DEA441|nr:extracellular solute-binding protein [Sinomonas sp. ASV486]MDQ4490829.1 extracellular solute-binding protein [Sinomonas sp. ASV486]